MSPSARWLLQRIALLDSPLLMIAAIACLFTDKPLIAVALALLSFALFTLGRPVIGMRYPPGDARNPEPAAPSRRRQRAPRDPERPRDERPKQRDRTRIRRTPL
jgi:hypothetical protein